MSWERDIIIYHLTLFTLIGLLTITFLTVKSLLTILQRDAELSKEDIAYYLSTAGINLVLLFSNVESVVNYYWFNNQDVLFCLVVNCFMVILLLVFYF